MRTPPTSRPLGVRRLLVVAAVAGGVLLAACSSSSSNSTTTTTSGTTTTGGGATGSNAAYLAADLKAPGAMLNGSGSSFVQPLLAAAFPAYSAKNSAVQINYQAVGSGAGIAAFQQGTVNFANTDVPMSSSDLAKMPAGSGTVIQIPDSLGGVSVSYNLPGITSHLKLDGAVLAGIFDGTIKDWNSSQITALNPGVSLPSNAIVPEVRSDSSGTTYIFTDYLSSVSSTWKSGPGTGKTVTWPTSAVASPKNSGVAAAVKSTPYSIGYVELGYAIKNGFTYAAVKNAAGFYVVPTLASVAADAAQKPNVSPTDFSVVNEPGAASYPITGYTWVVLLANQTNATTGAATVKVLDWLTHTGGGQDFATANDYVVLPLPVQTSNRTQLLTATSGGKVLLTS